MYILISLLFLILILSFIKVNFYENMYFNIPSRYCNPSKLMSYDTRGDIPIPTNQIHSVPFYSSEFIQNTPKQCVDSSAQFKHIFNQ
jgi:hypothetical protein